MTIGVKRLIIIKMRIGLISDTHIPHAEKALPPEVMEAFRGVDLILHAGDICIPSVLDDLESIAPVLAAKGDEEHDITLIDERVKKKHILKLEGKTLWLIHDRPYAPISPSWLPMWWQSKTASEQDNNDKPDIVVFGHEHRIVVQHNDDVLFVSPGSPTFLNYLQGLGTVGILYISADNVDVRILQLK